MIRRSTWWPFLASVIILGHAAHTAITADPDNASKVAGFVAGYASALAFVWLVAGYALQREELRLQRKELRDTREMMGLQKEEARRLAESAALGQIATLLLDFRNRLPAHGIHGLNTYEDITHKVLERRDYLGRACRASDADQVISEYINWRTVEGIALRFLLTVQMAAGMYARDVERAKLVEEEDPVDFTIRNAAALGAIPHISDCMHAARVLATVLGRLAPWRRRGFERYISALAKLMPGMTAETELDAALDAQIRAFESENPL